MATLAVLSIGGLSACQTKVGLAGAVNSHHLTDSDLSGFVKHGAGPYTDQSSGSKVLPKVYALENWLDLRLFEAAATKHGGAPTEAELSAATKAVLGTHTRADFVKVYSNLGYTDRFADVIIAQSATLVVLVERLAQVSPADAISVLQSGQAGSSLLKAVNATKAKVVVSKRYGTWDPSHLAISSEPLSGLPGFVEHGGTSSSPASAP